MIPDDRGHADVRLRELREELSRLRIELEAADLDGIDVDPAHVVSAKNLTHFLVLRSRDRRPLQDGLAELGLSSLGRCEAHVLATVAAVQRALSALCGDVESLPPLPEPKDAPGQMSGRMLLDHNSHDLLGPAPLNRSTRIMVTLPSEAATNPELVEQFVAAGMDVARINGAHDDQAAWIQMADHVHRAAVRSGRPVKIVMDLAGPKLRTTEIDDGPAVLRLKPRRDDLGRVVEAARGRLPVVGPIVALGAGDALHLTDTRDARRELMVTCVGPEWVDVTVEKTTYLTNGSVLSADGGASIEVSGVPPLPGAVLLRTGDTVWLMSEGVVAPDHDRPRVGCTLPEAIAAARVGHRVIFDDGKIPATVADCVPGGLLVEITGARPNGTKLRNEKGINLPDTDIPTAALTQTDHTALDTVVRIADAVELSFVRHPDDVSDLRNELAARGADDLGIILKIETLAAFRHLPELVHAVMSCKHAGIMIARGDLAVEVGYQRLAEVQEEILWLCEAAHLPVIWATQVLDTLARTGQPSRAEITDAAMSERADCVMLNKGPHMPLAIATLDDILQRMAGHQSKKRPLLRPLRSWIRE